MLTFDVPGEKPRAKDSTRVGPGYATFAVYGVGDAGRNTVEVVAPSSMTFDATSDDFTSEEKGSTTTHTVDGHGPRGRVLGRGLPARPGAGRRAPRRRRRGLPAAQRVPGRPEVGRLRGGAGHRRHPGAGEARRGRRGRAASSGSARTPRRRCAATTAGSTRRDDEIVIGEQLDADLIFHELSHAWVSGERFDERWVSEGLAQVLAERTVLGHRGHDPARHPTVSRRSERGRRAQRLGRLGGQPLRGRRRLRLPRRLRRHPGARSPTSTTSELAEVLGAGLRGERAYDPVGTKDSDGGRTTWSRWLDLLETRGGGRRTPPEVFRRWALTGEQRAQLAPRAEARAAYATVDEADGAWLPPEGLRDAMTAWDFERAASVRGKMDGPRRRRPGRCRMPPTSRRCRGPGRACGSRTRRRSRTSSTPRWPPPCPMAAAAVTGGGAGRAGLPPQDRDPRQRARCHRARCRRPGRAGATALLDEGATTRPPRLAGEATEPVRQGHARRPRPAAAPAAARRCAALGAGSCGARCPGRRQRGRWLQAAPGAPCCSVGPRGGRRVRQAAPEAVRGQRHAQHPGVAQGVGLDPLEVEELGDALVVAAQQLGVDLRVDGLALDRREAVPREERRLEGEAEQPAQAEQTGPLDERARARRTRRRCRARTSSTARVRTSPRSSQSTCSAPQPTTRPSTSATTKSVDRLVVGDGLLVEQHPSLGQRRDERADRADVGRARRADDGTAGRDGLRGVASGRHEGSVAAAAQGAPCRSAAGRCRGQRGAGHGRGPPPQGWWRAAAQGAPEVPCETQSALRATADLGKDRFKVWSACRERPPATGASPATHEGPRPGGRGPS